MASLIRPEIIDWIIQLYYAEKRIDTLQDTLGRLDTLAQKQVAIAENLLTTECDLINLASAAAGQATSTPLRSQEYVCAAERANVNALAQIGRETQRAMRGFDAYQCGARRATIRGAHVAMARGAGSAKANAMRNEDAMFDNTLEWRFANIASATGGFSYSANGFAGINRFYQNLAGDLVGDINRYVGEAVAGIGAFFGERATDSIVNQKVEVEFQNQPSNILEGDVATPLPQENRNIVVEPLQESQQVVVLSDDNSANTTDTTPTVSDNSSNDNGGG